MPTCPLTTGELGWLNVLLEEPLSDEGVMSDDDDKALAALIDPVPHETDLSLPVEHETLLDFLLHIPEAYPLCCKRLDLTRAV